ncbi:MAG: polyphenol oxidase family protein [Chthoniobacteraceae bacterium]|nr:polyphenol oxidase family protein [Chthoniobacteraceae bacterium]
MSILVETFPAVAIGGQFHNAFIGRVSDLDVTTDRATALKLLAEYHDQARHDLGFGGMPFVTAEQVHGNGVAVVDETTHSPVAGVDALVTNRPGVCLGVYVADCCAVYAVDTEHDVIGLAHSGRKGTALGVVAAMIKKMGCAFGSDPAQMIVQLSPCIRPPLYEVDFAAEIIRQCHALGVGEVVDSGACTGANLDRYYSYRLEKGQTGRMLALLALPERDGS